MDLTVYLLLGVIIVLLIIAIVLIVTRKARGMMKK